MSDKEQNEVIKVTVTFPSSGKMHSAYGKLKQSLDWESLRNTPGRYNLDMSEMVDWLKKSDSIFFALTRAANDFYLEAETNAVVSKINQFTELISEFQNPQRWAASELPKHTAEAESFIKRARELCRELTLAIGPAMTRIYIIENPEYLMEQANLWNNKTEEVFNTISRKVTEIFELVQQTKDKLSSEAVAEWTKEFENESELHRKASNKWFWGIITTMALGIVFTIFIGYFLIRKQIGGYTIPSDAASIAQLIAAKVIVLSFIFYGLRLTSKNYYAHRHNYIVNKHRALALKTFRTFVGATNDQAIKDAVLLKTTEAIFAAAPSAYLGKEPETSSGPQITEISKVFHGQGS